MRGARRPASVGRREPAGGAHGAHVPVPSPTAPHRVGGGSTAAAARALPEGAVAVYGSTEQGHAGTSADYEDGR